MGCFINSCSKKGDSIQRGLKRELTVDLEIEQPCCRKNKSKIH